MSAATLDLAGGIERVVSQDGHYLGEDATLKRMKTDYYLSPRWPIARVWTDWIDDGAVCQSGNRHSTRVAEILAAPCPTHLDAAASKGTHPQHAYPIHLEP